VDDASSVDGRCNRPKAGKYPQRFPHCSAATPVNRPQLRSLRELARALLDEIEQFEIACRGESSTYSLGVTRIGLKRL
jgi:hypothetical protein